MSFGRFELTDEAMYVKGVGPRKAALLRRLNIFTKYDLLTHYPRDYENLVNVTKICDIFPGEKVIVFGKIFNVTARQSDRAPITAWLTDGTGRIQVKWFNQRYLLPRLMDGMTISVTGKAEYDSWTGGLAISRFTR